MNQGVELITDARKKKLAKMTDEELRVLNEKLIGRSDNFITAERIEVCQELGRRLAYMLREQDNDQPFID